jgi:hypothetical protein
MKGMKGLVFPVISMIPQREGAQLLFSLLLLLHGPPRPDSGQPPERFDGIMGPEVIIWHHQKLEFDCWDLFFLGCSRRLIFLMLAMTRIGHHLCMMY